jgi:hypothetical protein
LVGVSENEHCSSTGGAERRAHMRYPCRLCVSWRTLDPPLRRGESMIGTLNISSKGVLFSSAEQFERGCILEVTLDWPVRLNQQVPLKLVIQGHVLRSTDGCTAMRITHYEFRTRGHGLANGKELPAVLQPAGTR